MNNQEIYLEERSNMYEAHKAMYLVISQEKDEKKAQIWAENLVSRFDEFCNEAYEEARPKLNDLPEKAYFLEQFPIGVKSKVEPVEQLELEEGSTLEAIYKDQITKINKQADMFIDSIMGRAVLKRPELISTIFGINLD